MSKRSIKLVGISAVAFWLFNFPMVSIVSKGGMILGIPIAWFYIGTVWLVLVVMMWRVADATLPKSNDTED